MEVMVPSPATDFSSFDANCTLPSRPRPVTAALFLSAPSSPARSSAAVPFIWEERPGTPKSTDDDTFQFHSSGHLNSVAVSLPADELFHGGKIRPLKPPPKFYYEPTSPKSPTRLIRASLSPRRADFDPFTAALEETRRGKPEKPSRSLSPFRASDLLFDPEPDKSESGSIFSLAFWYKKWKIKDLSLFRSHAGSRRTSSRRRSAHELHYSVNRPVLVELKKRTPLPYGHGFLSCLGFHPPCPEMSRGLIPTPSLPRG